MKKYLLKVLTLFIIFGSIAGCKNDNTELGPTLVSLMGTWKLEGFVDVSSGTLIEAEPKDCDVCYTITFNSDTTATGKLIANTIWIKINNKIPTIGLATAVGDNGIGNVALFYEAIKSVKTCTYVAEEYGLRFYYNNNQNYLLFKKKTTNQ